MNGFQNAVRVLITCRPWPLKLTPCRMNHAGSANQPHLVRSKPHFTLVFSALWKPCFQEIMNHEFFSLSFPPCICSERTLKTRTAYHAEKGRSVSQTVHSCTRTHCVLFLSVLCKKTFLQEVKLRSLGKENWKFLNLELTPARTKRKKKMSYMAKNVALSCTTYSVCPKNLCKECPFSRSPTGLCMSPNRMRVYVSQLVYP